MTAQGVPSVTVLGAGSFGTAMAAAIARSGYAVDLYCRTAEQAEEIRQSRENRRFFPGHRLSDLVTTTSDIDAAIGAEILFLAFPASKLDSYVERLVAARSNAIVVNLIKGLHPEYFTFARLFAETLPDVRYVALKGPTFARPIFLGELSGLTCGTSSESARARVQALLASSSINLDYCQAPEAVDALSAIKNVYAVALGIGGALGLSENTIFLMVSRVVKEIKLMLRAIDNADDALLTYCGLGDMLLTGLCDTSRNRTLGFMLGRGLYIDTVRSGFLTEGVRTFSILKKRFDMPLPILDTVIEILEHRAPPIEILKPLEL
jgi:glycerol-3-phosphate dehydrogenase (NAD(P)+)